MEKWELHCHTAEVSKCSQVLAEKMVSIYIKMGYDGIVVTDHFNQGTFENLESASVEEKINFFLNGYYNTIRAAKNRIKVLLGMELCCGSSNDYLIYGINKTFLKLYHNQV